MNMFFKTKKDFEEAVERKVCEKMSRYEHDRYVDDRLNTFSRNLDELRETMYKLDALRRAECECSTMGKREYPEVKIE